MIKFLSRTILATLAGIVCCCVAEPEAPRGVLKYFTDPVHSELSDADPSAPSDPSGPRLDAAIANAALAMQPNESPRSLGDATKPAAVPSASDRLNGLFFSDDAAQPGASMFSKLPFPSLSGDAEPDYQPIDIGPAVQTNPFLQ